MLRAPAFTSEQTLFWHGAYLAAVALVLFLAPALLRLFLPFPAELDWWNRVLAIPLFNLGILCVGGALTRSRTLIKLSVAMRLWVMAALTALVVCKACADDRSCRWRDRPGFRSAYGLGAHG